MKNHVQSSIEKQACEFLRPRWNLQSFLNKKEYTEQKKVEHGKQIQHKTMNSLLNVKWKPTKKAMLTELAWNIVEIGG